ncbi:hypothetical protein ACTXM3_08540 [Glutamicibacter arilaitensis]|uniref:hypothetical protein n=1 Tax=Glutamicibacter arilaitensis TaxID=256701 RepID=UPI003FD2B8DF
MSDPKWRKRQPKGQSSGGQFSFGRKAESPVSLLPASKAKVGRSTQMLEDYLEGMSDQEYSRYVCQAQKRSLFARLNPPPAPDRDGHIEPDVQLGSAEEDERLDGICKEIGATVNSRSLRELEKFKPYGLSPSEMGAIAEKHHLSQQSVKDLAFVSSDRTLTNNADVVAKNLKTGKARAVYSKLSDAGADLTFVPVEYDHQPGVLHFGAMHTRKFSAEIDDAGRIKFGHEEMEGEQFGDADVRDTSGVTRAYYDAAERGLEYKLRQHGGIGARFDPETGKVTATRGSDDAQFSYDVRTMEATSLTGHPVPQDGLHELARIAYSHPLVSSRNASAFPHVGPFPQGR